jgi:hypothetical protein
VHRHDRVAGVVRPGEEALLLELREPRLDLRALTLQLAGDRLVLGRHLLERLEVVDVLLELLIPGQLALRPRVLGRHLRRALLVVPEGRLLHLLLERLEALL